MEKTSDPSRRKRKKRRIGQKNLQFPGRKPGLAGKQLNTKPAVLSVGFFTFVHYAKIIDSNNHRSYCVVYR